jgi:hypothetical protein
MAEREGANEASPWTGVCAKCGWPLDDHDGIAKDRPLCKKLQRVA